MTYKITTDFAGTESLATTKTRLESILDFWLGSGSTSSVSTWGDIRTLLNTVAPAAITIADGELASSFRTKLNTLNSTDGVVSNLLFSADEPGVWYDPSDLTTLFQDTAGTTPVTTPGQTVGLMLDKSGNDFHATQPTAAARPTYGIVPETGRRNLLGYTEEFDNGYWLKSGSTTVSANTIAAPDGALTADRVSGASGTDFTGSVLRVNSGVFPTSSSNTLSAHVVADGATTVRMYYRDGTTGIVYSTAAISLTASWQRITLSVPTANGGVLFWGAADGDFGIWGAQLETGSTATAYQRVGSRFDVTEAGVPSLGYLSFDGVDDFMVTPTITPGTDKVQVFAGVRKLSDAVGSGAVFAEMSTDSGSNNGTIGAFAPLASATTYGFRSRGTAAFSPIASGSLPAPTTNIFTGIGDISGDLATLRIDGTQVAQSTADQGTGNYLAYPMYIGRRGGTTLPFNGHIYSLITRFGPNLSSDVIGRAETYTAQKTGVTL